MEYNENKKEIVLNKQLNKLDGFVIDFLRIAEKYTDYVIVSGYVSIVLGRTRATEDIDIFVKRIGKEEFFKLYEELLKNGFECINAENPEEVFSYINDGYGIRFYRNSPIPNFEVRFPKRKIDDDTLNDFIVLKLPNASLKISSLERQIAFKKYYLKADKDIEDAMHIEELFKEKLDHKKINKLKNLIKQIKK